MSNSHTEEVSLYKRIINTISIFILLLSLVVVAIVITVLFQNIQLFAIDFEKGELSSLLNTIWQVQVGTVAAFAITLMTIMIGFSGEKVYGIRIIDYVSIGTKIMGFRYNFWDGIFTIISLIVVMYLFVVYECLAGSIFIFQATIVIVIVMMRNVLDILGSSKKTRNRIQKIIIGNVINEIRIENKSEKEAEE